MKAIPSMKQALMAAAAATALVAGSGGTADASNIPFDYLYEYRGDRMPNAEDANPTASPTWSVAAGAPHTWSSSEGFEEIEGLVDPGFLRMEIPTGTTAAWGIGDHSSWNVEDSGAFTIEFRLKILDSTGSRGFWFTAGSDASHVVFTADSNAAGIGGAGGASSNVNVDGFDPTQYNAYRLVGVRNDGVWSYELYLNDIETPVATAGARSSGALNTIRFGNLASATGVDFDVDYIRWNNTAAIPVPEPASLTLLGLGALAMVGRRRCRRDA